MRGTGDKNADWRQEMKQAIARQVHVPLPAEQDWKLEGARMAQSVSARPWCKRS